MKKQLLTGALALMGTLAFAQSIVPANNHKPTAKPDIRTAHSNAGRTVACGNDTAFYTYLKEETEGTGSYATVDLYNGLITEYSQTYLNSGSLTVKGISFWGGVTDAVNPAQTVTATLVLYNVNASFQPTTVITSKTMTLNTTLGFNTAMFTTPQTLTGNYAIAIKNTSTTDTVSIVVNNAEVGTYDEGFSYLNAPAFGGWFATSAAFTAPGAYEAIIAPVVSYTINTDYTMSPSNTTMCVGTPLTFTNTTTPSSILTNRMYNYGAYNGYFNSVPDSIYAWDMGDGSPLQWSTNAAYSYPAAGTDTVTLITIGGLFNTCIDTKETYLTVNATPVLAITSPAPVCSPSTVDLTASAVTAGSTGGGTISYWTDAAATSALSSPAAVAASGTYYIQSANGSCMDIDPVTVTVNPADNASFTVPTGMVCTVDAPFNLTATTSGGMYSGTGITNATAGTFDPSVAGSGTFTITYTTAGICPSTATNTITVSVCMGVEGHDAAATVNVYPNPSNGMVNVDLGRNAKSTITVYNVIGAEVLAKEFNAQIASVDMSGFEAGVYFVKVTTDNGQVTKQITITK
ncbi:MAG: hypothetical protein JWO09_3297 [Bacteroidetes bacterium]|nr:hypothetical protein [Bacteroidota bacterium]